MNPLALSGLLVFLFSLVLSIIALIYGRLKIHRILVFLNIAIAVWGGGLFIVGKATTESIAILGWKFGHVGGIFIGVIFYHLVYLFCELKRRGIILVNYLIGLIFVVITFITSVVINRVRFIFSSIYINIATLPYTIIVVWWLFIVSLSFYELLRFLHNTEGDKRKQTLYMIFGFLIGFLGGASTFLSEFGMNVYPFGNFSIPIYCSVVTYAILKYKFMDIKIGFSRIAVYAMIFAFVIGIPVGLLFLNLFALAGLSVAVFCSILSFIVFAVAKTKLHRLLILFNVVVAFWGIGSFIVGIATIESMGILGWKLAHFGGFLISPIFYHMVCIFCKVDRKRIFYFAYLQALCFELLNMGTPYLINKTRVVFGIYYNDVTLLLVLGILLYLTFVILSYYELMRFLKITKGIERIQTLYIIFGFLFGFVGGTSTFLPEFRIDIFYPIGNFGITLYCLIVTYAILRHRILDVRIAVTRTAVFVIVYTLVLGLPFLVGMKYRQELKLLVGDNWWTLPLGLMAVLATLGPFIFIYLNRKAEDRLLKTQRDYQMSLKQASMGMTRIRNLKRLLDLIAHILTKTVKISYVAIYLYDDTRNTYLLQISRDKGRTSLAEVAVDSVLVSYLKDKRQPLVYEEIKRLMQDTKEKVYEGVEQDMRLLTASVVIPSFLEDKLMGLFILGDKNSGDIYTDDDLNVFQVLANQAALAIENAKFYEEAKEMQDQISQAEKMATIGTMADGLSHQLNNRFYALSLIAGNSIDTIKLTDTSKCSPEIKAMIEEISYALDRIQANVMQGGDVVRGLLKYSRKGEAGVEALDLNKIIDNTLEMVQYKVKLSEIDIVRDFNHAPLIKGNMTQLEEVFFNFIDNAYDSIVERRTTLKEEGYRGRIVISAKSKDTGMVEIVVEDNGMGMKSDDVKKIFTPFFTTKISARKGTGLGLYVIKRIIADTHKGKISFESDYKVGTRFIVELPAAG